LSDAGATSAFALIHSVLLAFGDEPSFAPHVLEGAIVHHLAIEPAQQAVERFVFVKLNGHRSHLTCLFLSLCVLGGGAGDAGMYN
jgi:hypothetical protein